MNNLISLKKVYKIYNPGESELHALDGISLQIKEGEFIAIIGQSGSGKSTLMNIIGCLDIPTSGEYLLKDKNVSTMSDRSLSEIRNKEIGFIFQGFNLIPSLDSLENVELPLIYRGISKSTRRKLAIDALIRVGLQSRLHHKPSQMSGGQQQRVAIARAIASSPSIILADEPTGNLDSKSGEDIMKILIELNELGKTVILITHDNKIAEKSKKILRIMDGKIV